MTTLMKKTAVAAALALAFGVAQAANTTISGGGVTAVINDAGTFTSYFESGSSPAGTPGLSYYGTEYVNWGTPWSWNWLKANGTDFDSTLGGNPRGGTTGPAFPPGMVANSFSAGGLNVLQTFSVLTPGMLTVTVNITNVADGGGAIGDVWWGVGLDPDQGLNACAFCYTTTNTILGQGTAAAVKADDLTYGSGASLTLRNDTTSGAFDIRAFIGWPDRDPSVTFGLAQGTGYSNFSDTGISLSYKIGSIADGGSASLGYSYVMTAPIPEPETYAMLLAGLGLMGFVARRRKGMATA